MASTRHHKRSVGVHRTTGKQTRSSSGLRMVAKMQTQTSLNRRQSHRKDITTVMRKGGCSRNRISRRPQAYQAASPQRSSLRRAIRESLELSRQSMQFTVSSPIHPTKPPISSTVSLGCSSPQVEPHISVHQYKCRTRTVNRRAETDITATTTTRSLKVTRASALELKPQRNSLRRAIRESLEAMKIRYKDPVLQASYPKILIAAQSPKLGLVSTEKLKAATDRPVHEKKVLGNTRLSSNPKGQAISHTKPQRSSLRRAVRESLLMVQWDASIGTVSNEVNSDPDLTRKDAMKDPLRSSDSDNDVAISSPDSPGCGSGIPIPLPDAPLDIGSDAVTPSQFNRTSSVSCVPSTTTSPFPPTMTASRPLPNLRSRKRLTRELSLLRTPKVPLSLPSVPKSPSRFVSVPELGSKLVSPLSVQQQIPTLVSPAASTLGDGKSQTTLDDPQGIRTRRGWYQVRGIINEAPGGLYLVEWEGRDPRTGVKWPASWVRANNVSASAINDWKARNEQRAPS